MKHILLSTVAALAIVAAPISTLAQSGGGASEKSQGGASGGGAAGGGAAGGSSAGGSSGGMERQPSGGSSSGSGAEKPSAGGSSAGESSGSRGGASGGMEKSGGAEKSGGMEKSGAGGSDMKSGADSKSGSDMKSGADKKSGTETSGSDTKDRKERGGSSADKEMGGASGDKTRDMSRDKDRDGEDRARGKESDRNRGERSGDRGGDRDRGERSGDRGGDRGSRTSVNISTQQRTTIRQTIVSGGSVTRVPRSRLGGVSISVGVSVPRAVTVDRLPPRIVEIVPEYADYSYFVTDDDVIVIVDPDTYEVVYVIES